MGDLHPLPKGEGVVSSAFSGRWRRSSPDSRWRIGIAKPVLCVWHSGTVLPSILVDIHIDRAVCLVSDL